MSILLLRDTHPSQSAAHHTSNIHAVPHHGLKNDAILHGFFFTMLHLPHDIFKGFMPGNNSLPHPQLVVFFLVRFHRHDDFLFFFFLVVDYWRTLVVRTYVFFHALLCIFVFSDFICPVFHHGVSAVKYGGTYGSFFPRL
jgi:hypothetical protein